MQQINYFIFKLQQEKVMKSPYSNIPQASYLHTSAVYTSKSPKSPLFAHKTKYTNTENNEQSFYSKSYVFEKRNEVKQQSYLRNTISSPRNLHLQQAGQQKGAVNLTLRQTSYVSGSDSREDWLSGLKKTQIMQRRTKNGDCIKQQSPVFQGVPRKQSYAVGVVEPNLNKIMKKIDQNEKLITELKKIADSKISEKFRTADKTQRNSKNQLYKSAAYQNEVVIEKGDKVDKNYTSIKNGEESSNFKDKIDYNTKLNKNPEEQYKKNSFKKNKAQYYTPKTEKPKYQQKVESRWTPKVRKIFSMQQKTVQRHGFDRQDKVQKNQIQLIHDSYGLISRKQYGSPLGSMTDGIDFRISKDYGKDYKSIKDVRQIIETKAIQSHIKQSSQKRISIFDFQLGRSLGQGKFGNVYQAFHKQTQSIYALKKISKSIIKTNFMIDQFILEIKIQSFCNHENVLKLYGFFDDAEHIYLILEYMEDGTLYQVLKRNKTLSEEETANKLKQLTSGIKYLHANGIAHRDIKPENIVISNGVGKICDFGWAAICNDRRKTYCGTFDYAAPQILEGSEYDMSVDLWCLGVLAYELLVGRAPFYHISRKETMKRILNVEATSVQFPNGVSKDAVSLIESLIRKKPEERMSCDEILKHQFMLKGEDKI